MSRVRRHYQIPSRTLKWKNRGLRGFETKDKDDKKAHHRRALIHNRRRVRLVFPFFSSPIRSLEAFNLIKIQSLRRPAARVLRSSVLVMPLWSLTAVLSPRMKNMLMDYHRNWGCAYACSHAFSIWEVNACPYLRASESPALRMLCNTDSVDLAWLLQICAWDTVIFSVVGRQEAMYWVLITKDWHAISRSR